VRRRGQALHDAMNEIATLRSLSILMTLAWIVLLLALSA
jgi:hypothetical protein